MKFIAALLCLLAPGVAWPQGETTSAIVGLVADETGSGIPDALVTVVGEDDGQARRLRTGDGGRFSFPQLKPGRYTVAHWPRGSSRSGGPMLRRRWGKR